MNGRLFGNALLGNQEIFGKDGLLRRTRLRAVGGPAKRVAKRTAKFQEYETKPTPIAMCDWADWLGGESQGRERLDEQPHKLIGGAKAPGAIRTYERCFRKWSEFRELQNKPALITPGEDRFSAEVDVLRFSTLHHGPLQKTAATVELYLRALAYAHRLHTGVNPMSEMHRVKLLLQGARRDEGPPQQEAACFVRRFVGNPKGLNAGVRERTNHFLRDPYRVVLHVAKKRVFRRGYERQHAGHV